MKESGLDTGLDDVRSDIARNHTFTGAQNAKNWADKLTEWAKVLDGENDKENGGGEGDGGSPSPEDEDFEFMLRVMKLVQQEQDLRSRTRVLEQLRRNFEKPMDAPGKNQPAPPSP
jgi:hypothetical protein